LGRGGGSGGRSFGGSFGGNRSSGGRSGGIFGGGQSRGSFSGNRGLGGIFGGSTGRSFPGPFSGGGSFGGGGGYHGGGSGGFGCGIVIIGLVILFVFLILLVTITSSNNSSTELTKSTVQREALPAGSVTETGYFTDELGWIGNQTQLLNGLKYFYQKTGVQPYLYITDNVNGSHAPSASELDAYARNLYDQLFTDEAHLLLVFFEYNNSYMDRYVCGTQAKTVIDTEAADILLDCIDRYYYDDSLTDDAFFSKAFTEAADRIMTVERSPWIMILLIFGLVALVTVLFVWWLHAKKQKNLEAQRTEEILSKPLEKFDEAEELVKKYEDPDTKE